jgi:O-antigen biosynthesis protein
MHEYSRRISKEFHDKVINFPRITFLLALIKKEVIDKIGGLDERFTPGNFEDDDYCLRAQLNGFKSFILQDVFIHHFGSKSFKASGLENYISRLEVNKNIFIRKWGADPDQIWIQGYKPSVRSTFIPYCRNKFSYYIEETLQLLKEKTYEGALDSISVSISDFPDNNSLDIALSDLYVIKGNIELLLTNVDEARSSFEKALNEDNQSSQACAGLGEIFFLEGNFESAAVMYEWAVKINPSNAAAVEKLNYINTVAGILRY